MKENFPMKILMFFAEMEKFILKHIWKGTLSRQKQYWGKKKKETKLEDLIHSDFKIYYKDMVIKILTWWHTDRHTEQLNRMETPEKKPFIYSLMNFETAYTCETVTIKVISLTSKSFLVFLCVILLTFLVRTFHMRSTFLNC